MASKPKKKLPRAGKPAAPTRSAAKRPPARVAAEHWIAVASVALAVTYVGDRAETLEFRGTATVNAGSSDGVVRTTGFVTLALRKGAKSANRVDYNPASLSRNLVFTLFADAADIALFRDIFVTGTGSEASDPALTLWVRTTRPLNTDTVEGQPVTAFGYRLDFDPAPMGIR